MPDERAGTEERAMTDERARTGEPMTSDDLTSVIRESLSDRAERGVRADGLHDRVLVRSRRIRRRRTYAAASGAGLAMAVAMGVLVVPGLRVDDPSGLGWAGGPATAVRPTATAGAGGPTTLPPATGALTAAQAPARVGSDPAVLHFDLDLRGFAVADTEWTSGPRYEAVTIRLRPPAADSGTWGFSDLIQVYLGPDRGRLDAVRDDPVGTRDDGGWLSVYPGARELDAPAAVDIAGRPGNVRRVRTVPPAGQPRSTAESPPTGPVAPAYAWVVEWQPADGLYAVAQVRDGDRALAVAVARAVRTDRAQRCAVPARLRPPADGVWTTCTTRIRPTNPGNRSVWISSRLFVAQADGGRLDVFLEAQSTRPDFVATRTVDGHPATWLHSGPRGLWIINFGPAEVFVGGWSENDPDLSVPEAVDLIEGMRISADLADPRTWPDRAIPSR
jgi:hypothetical protein